MFRLYFFLLLFFFTVFFCFCVWFNFCKGFCCCCCIIINNVFSVCSVSVSVFVFVCFFFSLYFLYLYKLQRKCRCICSWCWRQHRRGWRITQRVLRRCLLYVILTRIIQYAIPWVWMWSGAQQGDCLAFWTTLYTV